MAHKATVTIRPAAPGDYEAVCALADELDRPAREAMPDRFRKPAGPARAREYVLGLIADTDTRLLVAETAGRVVGIVNAGVGRTPDVPVKKPRTFVLIRGIVVLPGFRRRGIGRSLLAAACEWAAARGAAEVQLSAYDFNLPARRFFEHLGFRPLSHRLFRPV